MVIRVTHFNKETGKVIGAIIFDISNESNKNAYIDLLTTIKKHEILSIEQYDNLKFEEEQEK